MDQSGNSANIVSTSLIQPEPVRASQLSVDEVHQHDRLSRMKPLKYGCTELDNAVLLGGLRRGSIVGVSADDVDGFGLLMGLQVMTKAILHGSAKQALVITPKSQASISRLIMDIVRSELSKTDLAPANIQQKCLASLEKVTLSVVFDTDGLWQTLLELRVDDNYGGAGSSQLTAMSNNSRSQSSFSFPDIIIVTHFSTLLTSLFTRREKSAAHQSIALLKEQLRLLSNCSTISPLILLLNSNTSEAVEVSDGLVPNSSGHENPCQTRHIEATLCSLFTFPLVRPTRPSFGLVFSQFLDLHLLCTNLANLQAATSDRCYATHHSPTLVEVLRDESSPSFRYNSQSTNLEQRWAVLAMIGNCIVNPWQD